MRWRSVAILVGVIVAGWIGWQLTPTLQSLSVLRQTGTGTQLLSTGWGILREPALWPLIAVGMLMGWFVGRLEGLWTGSEAAKADWQAARQALDRETAYQTRWVEQERNKLDRSWTEVLEARQTAEQTQQEIDAARARMAATQDHWERWAKAEVAQAKAETAEAKQRSRNAIATAERRKRKLDRVLSERSHTA